MCLSANLLRPEILYGLKILSLPKILVPKPWLLFWTLRKMFIRQAIPMVLLILIRVLECSLLQTLLTVRVMCRNLTSREILFGHCQRVKAVELFQPPLVRMENQFISQVFFRIRLILILVRGPSVLLERGPVICFSSDLISRFP